LTGYRRWPSWERGGVAGLDQAGAMTTTLANSTWGAVLDEQAIPGSAP
jgi:hypothetical protein